VLSLVLLGVTACVPAVCQTPDTSCDAINHPFAYCALRARADGHFAFKQDDVAIAELAAPATDGRENTELVSTSSQTHKKQGVHWGRVLLESFELLSIEQAYVVHTDWNWVGGKNSENGVPFNHYWRDYKQSLSAWIHAGWNDGDPNMYGYVGHPIQGLAVSYIFLQNDPKDRGLEFSKTKAYWISRLKATAFNAAYSTQWNIGPLSEPTIEKYGTHWRSPWNQNGTWPCNTKNCYTGMGQIDLVMTPLGGLGWLVGEDILDRFITRRVEASTRNRTLIDITRCGLDPVQIGTNLLHGKRPWYRPRDTKEVDFTGEYRHSPSQAAGIRNSEAGESY
jgi:hypothetical protein